MKSKYVCGLIVAVLWASPFEGSVGAATPPGSRLPVEVPQAAQLTPAQKQMLRAMREEEKLARDVYRTLGAKTGMQIFQNISGAESQHMSAVAQLLARYGIPDPLTNDQTGVFASANFQKLYRDLVQAGSASPVAAIQVGLKIEEMDIADLRQALASNPPADVQRVLSNLERGSRNHLRAFARQLQAVGGTYQPQHLAVSEFNRIASSPQEAGGPQASEGPGQARGRGPGAGLQGQGQGRGGQGGQGKRGGSPGRGGPAGGGAGRG